MKLFCNEVMKITPNFPQGTDFSTICMLSFISESLQKKEFCSIYNIIDFANYLYQFYCDIPLARETHYHKMINNIYHYEPMDLNNYCRNILQYTVETTEIIELFSDHFILKKSFDKNESLLFSNIVNMILYKNLKINNYTTAINPEDFLYKSIFKLGDKVFNRIISRRNYCFICNNENIEELSVIPLMPISKAEFNPCNYILLCDEHSNEFLSGNLIIKKNGYAYLYGKRINSHIAIKELKLIRENLK